MVTVKMRTICGTILAAVMLSGAVFAATTDLLAVKPEGDRGMGALVLSFDDRNLADWEKSIPLFDKYGAHATFFCTGKIEGDAARVLKKLRDHGHSIGLHGLNHLNANEAVARKGLSGCLNDEIAPQLAGCRAAGGSAFPSDTSESTRARQGRSQSCISPTPT